MKSFITKMTNDIRRITITAPVSYLEILKRESEQSKTAQNKAASLLTDKEFHGAPTITNFETLEEATRHGIPFETIHFKNTISEIQQKTLAKRLSRTDEPSRIVDPATFLEGIPECFFKLNPSIRESYNITFYLGAPWFTKPKTLQNRAAAMVALIKHLKARGAALNLEIADALNYTSSGVKHQAILKFPINVDALNIGQIAFFTSPAFFRTYIFMAYENIFKTWNLNKKSASKAISNLAPENNNRINLKSFQQQEHFETKTYKEIEAQYDSPQKAFDSIEKEFKSEIVRLSARR